MKNLKTIRERERAKQITEQFWETKDTIGISYMIERTGYTARHMYRLTYRDDFPKPVSKKEPNTLLWRKVDFENWLERTAPARYRKRITASRESSPAK